jgi:hypothetical protein
MGEVNNIHRSAIAACHAEFSFWIDGGIRNNIESAIQELSRLHVTAALATSARPGHIRITGLNHPAIQFTGMDSPVAALQGTMRLRGRGVPAFSRRC